LIDVPARSSSRCRPSTARCSARSDSTVLVTGET
jgi:hypothetical protein